MPKGFAPENDEEARLFGMKQGLVFIADRKKGYSVRIEG